MKKTKELEANILSCLLQRPELMEKVIVPDEYFKSQNRMWKFMKTFYSKFKNFDLILMTSICKNKFQLIEYIKYLILLEPAPSRFDEYQKQLIELHNEEEKDKWIIDKIYDLSNELYVRKIKLNNYKDEVDKIFKNAEEIFKKSKEE